MDEEEKGLRGNFSYSYDVRDSNHNIDKDAVRKNTPYYHPDFKENLQFIISHFQEPIFPRTISTQESGGRQISVQDINHVYQEFEKSKFIDCRINAFPSIENPVPNFIFIDLDDIHKNISLDKILEITLTNFKKRLGGVPTVLQTGNGYHIYQPIDNPQRFEDMEDFKELDNLDNKFWRFGKDYLSSEYADKTNYPSLKSCLLRVPGSLNSKCITKGFNKEESKVKILQVWDGRRPPIKYMIGTYFAHLKSEKLKEEKKRLSMYRLHNNSKPQEIDWIEKLLVTPIDDFRYLCLWHILIPYLVNVKKIPGPKTYSILDEWLKKCETLRKKDFDIKYTIKYSMKNVKDFRPISFDELKRDYPDLFTRLQI